jgi:hypothetical protein
MGEYINKNVRNLGGKRSLAEPNRKWKDIAKIDLNEIVFVGSELI